MLDDSDGDFVLLAGLGLPGALGLIALCVWLFVQCRVNENHDECAARKCSAGMQSKLMAHDCLCVEKAR